MTEHVGERTEERPGEWSRGRSGGRFVGRVALVTGAARGQGRSHALRLAEEGADVVLVDACVDVGSAPYDQPGPDALQESRELVEKTGRRCLARQVDVRDRAGMADVVVEAGTTLGTVDLVVANAGVISFSPAADLEGAAWDEIVGINLTGAWNTVQPCLQPMLDAGRGGAIVLISSAAGLKGPPNLPHYAAAKTGLVGLMRSLANELGPAGIRVNTLHPTTVDTPMVHWQGAYDLFRPDLEHPGREDVVAPFAAQNVLPVPWISPSDVSDALLWLLSDEARYVTGVALPVDAGTVIK